MFENKKVLILGMARSGYEAAKILVKKKIFRLIITLQNTFIWLVH